MMEKCGKPNNRAGVIATALASVVLGGPAASQAPGQVFAEPTGPYPTGVTEFFWVDESRTEDFTADQTDRRHLLVRIWYPAEPAPDAEKSAYIWNLEEFADPQTFAIAAEIQTHSVRDAPWATDRPTFPVLVFSHGFAWTRFTDNFVTEGLASHGYVVVSIGHTGANRTNRFPDDYEFVMNANMPPEGTGDTDRDARAFWEYLTDTHAPVWLGDISFVLNQLEELNEEPGQAFHERLDFDRVGAFGWSFGGAMAVATTVKDRRVKAAVDLDGQLFGDVIEMGTDRPVMLMHSTLDDPGQQDATGQEALDRLKAVVEQQNETFLEKSRNDWYDLRIQGTQHGSFSDLVLFTGRLEGELAPPRAHEVINVYTLAFFNRYLMGANGLLLSGASDAFPEVIFRQGQR
jgi:predicted dienelactone hydrolase